MTLLYSSIYVLIWINWHHLIKGFPPRVCRLWRKSSRTRTLPDYPSNTFLHYHTNQNNWKQISNKNIEHAFSYLNRFSWFRPSFQLRWFKFATHSTTKEILPSFTFLILKVIPTSNSSNTSAISSRLYKCASFNSTRRKFIILSSCQDPTAFVQHFGTRFCSSRN